MWTELPDDVKAELQDPKFLTRKHYSRATYALGCHGPLCGAKERDRGRIRNEERAKSQGREYRPVIKARDLERDALMNKIVDWYLAEHAAGLLKVAV